MTGGMMFKGTPGPWWVDEDGWVAGGKGHPVCMFSLGTGDSEMSEREKNDGHLIAAAPDLLEALMPTMNLAMWTESAADDELVIMSVGTVRKMRAAIAKALGEQK